VNSLATLQYNIVHQWRSRLPNYATESCIVWSFRSSFKVVRLAFFDLGLPNHGLGWFPWVQGSI
jgi:hypothetical protein